MCVEEFLGVFEGVVALFLACGFHAVDADGGAGVGESWLGVLVGLVEGVTGVG